MGGGSEGSKRDGGSEADEESNFKSKRSESVVGRGCLETRLITLGIGLILLPWELFSEVACPYDNCETHGGEPALCCGEKYRAWPEM